MAHHVTHFLRHRRFTLSALLLMAGTLAMAGLACPTTPPPPDDGSGDPTTGDSGLTGKYVGAARCSQCHSNVHNDWLGTLHSKAYETLEAIGQGANSDCIGCHTVGFGDTGGFVDRATTNSLAGVQCESCHGPGGEHAANVNDESLRPKLDISSSVCGKCHTGDHHPNFEDWQTSKHASVNTELIPRFAAGTSLISCGKCHSGDYYYRAIIKGQTVADNALAGLSGSQMAGITCVICHNPHAKTGNAPTADEGRDYQLRHPLVKYATPTTDLTAAQDPTRFNLCGQCHHTRDRVWTDSSREPHPSDQVNVFFGEMPLPASNQNPIVPSRASVHLNTPEQCSTCHVYRKPIVEGIAPAVSGHSFEVHMGGCVSCHGTEEIAQAKLNGLKSELEYRNHLVEVALDAWAAKTAQVNWCSALNPAPTGPCWEFTSEGGPANNAGGQAKIPDGIKKARYILYYFRDGGGNGVHNPGYMREALMLAEQYASGAPDVVP